MVKITTHPPSIASASPFVKRARGVEPVKNIQAEHKSYIPRQKPFVERRKNNRRTKNSLQGPYDQRCGGDRRKANRKGQMIEVEV